MAENHPIRPRRTREVAPVREVVAPDPPAHLSEEAKGMWGAILEEWVLGPDSLPLLRGALENWDTFQKCREQVAAEGATVSTGEGMIRQHPAAKLSLDSFAAFRMAMKQLGLEPPK